MYLENSIQTENAELKQASENLDKQEEVLDEKIKNVKAHIKKSNLNTRHLELIHRKIEVEQEHLEAIYNTDKLEAALDQWSVRIFFIFFSMLITSSINIGKYF